MQLSRYLKIYGFDESPGHLLLFSTKKASKILIKEETFQAIERDTLSPSDEALLSKLGMIVPDRDEEKHAVLGLFDDLNAQGAALHMIVILNLDCNFSCVYCFEGDIKGDLYMSYETADRLIGFIKERFTEDKRYLLVDFYGGEPLLSARLIKYISGALKPFVESRDASYSFSLFTNGSLFKRRVAKELVPLGLESVKVTLDGPADIHDRYRPFRSGAGSFDTVIQNIKDTCDLVKLRIGGNFERDNYERFPLLLDYLENEGLTPEKISIVKFDPVLKHPRTEILPTHFEGGCISVREPWLWKADALLRGEILKRAYDTPKPGPMRCMVENRDSCVVNFDGVIYKCPAFVGKKGFAVGDLRTGVRDYTSSYNLGFWKNEECAECEYLPLCFGGCRYMTFVRDGNVDALDCQKEYLDASLETLIKQDITYRLSSQYRGVRIKESKSIDVSEMTEKIDRVIERYFPKQFESFKPPSLDRMISCYRNTYKVIDTYVCGTSHHGREDPQLIECAFFTVAAIRYLDDFIDKALWPALPEFDPAALSALFDRFLEEVLQTVREFDPDIPAKTIELPKLEMHLALYPNQDNFDRNFRRLFEYKSFDMFYIYRKIQGTSVQKEDPDRLERIAVMEHIRDFSSDAIATDSDMNLYKYLRDNKLNPGQLIDYLIDVYRREDPVGYRKTRESGLFDGVETDGYVAAEDIDEGYIPFHPSFSMHFTRAIGLLRNLL